MDKQNEHIRKIVLTGLMIALVFIATRFIQIPSINGYIHFGDGFVFISAIVLGPFYGAFAAGIGSMLSDLLSPYAQWALPTFIVKSLMALIMGFVIRHKSKKQAFLTIGISLVVWVCFVAAIKSALTRALNFSVENLADAMDKSIENVQKSAGDVQLTLTIAIIIFLILIATLVYWIVKKKNTTGFGFGMVLGMTSAGTSMIIGYYITEIILYGNPISPVFSVPMNIIQLIMGFVITIVVAPSLRKAYFYIYGDKLPGDL